MPVLAVGCPVHHREWCLEAWFDHVEVAAGEAGIDDIAYLFVGDPEHDRATFEIIRDRAPDAMVARVSDGRPQDKRVWNQRRFRHMVGLRNLLLQGVRRLGPELFLSLDSDILLAPGALAAMLEVIAPLDSLPGQGWDAVGGRCYLSKNGLKSPSWGRLSRNGKLQRSDSDGTYPVDVIMAIKLMRPNAYAIDYDFDREGEDIGWSKACKAAGVRLGWTGKVISKHLWEPDSLEQIDPRLGW